MSGKKFTDAVKKFDRDAQFTPPELQRFREIKHCFDTAGLLNPGKLIPTAHRCAEFGRMHVHHGQVPFPDIPRL